MAEQSGVDVSVPPAAPLAVAVTFAGLYAALALLLRSANFLTLMPLLKRGFHWLGPPVTLPWLLGEDVVVAVIMGAALWYAGSRRGGTRRWGLAVVRAGISACLVWLCIDQVAYKLFYGHLTAAHLHEVQPSDLGALQSSIRVALNGSLWVELGSVAIVLWALWSGYRPEAAERWAARLSQSRPARLLTGAGVLTYVATHLALVHQRDQLDLDRSALVELASSAVDELWPAEVVSGSTQDWWPQGTKYGAPQPAEDFSEVRAVLEGQAKPLNVFHFVLESTAFRETSLDPRNPYDTTPFLRRLSETSLVFENFYAPFPGSSRALFALNSGVFPFTSKRSILEPYAALPIPTLCEQLKRHAYSCAVYSSGDTFYDSADKFFRHHGVSRIVDANTFPAQERARYAGTSWGLREEPVIDRALDWMAEQSSASQLTFVQYISTFPHHPYSLPDDQTEILARDYGDDGKTEYRRSLAYADRMIERVFDGLRSRGLLDSTVVLVTPDHGEGFAELHDKNVFHLDHVYEENVHTFAVAYHPMLNKHARISRRVLSHVNLMPTALDLALPGALLKSDAESGAAQHLGKSAISSDLEERPVFFFTSGFKTRGVRDGNLKFIETSKGPRLFDLSLDPDEQHDIAGERPEAVLAYEQWLERFQRAQVEFFQQKKRAARTRSDALRAALDERERGKVFGELPDPLDTIELCDVDQGGACATSDARFSSNAHLALRVRWVESGRQILKTSVRDRKGRRVLYRRELVDVTDQVSELALAFEEALEPGRYRLAASSGATRRNLSFRIE